MESQSRTDKEQMDDVVVFRHQLTLKIPEFGDKVRKWPHAQNHTNENNQRFCFKPGKMERAVWGWPWPEWLGLPTRASVRLWMEMLEDWRDGPKSYLGASDLTDDAYIDRCVNLAISLI